MGPDALRYIHESCFTQSPSELYQNLKASGAHGFENVTHYQVYYRWKQANKSSWRRHDDKITSSTTLLTEFGNSYYHCTFRAGDLHALGYYIFASIDALVGTTMEVTIDTSFGINSAGMDFYALLTGFVGTGVPKAYHFLEKDILTGMSSAGSLIQILDNFLLKKEVSHHHMLVVIKISPK